MSSNSLLKRKLRKDDRWIKFETIIERAYPVKFRNYLQEIKTIHQGRSVRNLSRKTSANTLLDANGQDQSYRSRCVEILIEVKQNYSLVDAMTLGIKRYILSTFSEVLNEHSTKGAKEQAVDTLLDPAYDKLTKLESLEEIANLVLKDIDQASYALQRHTTLYLETIKPEKGLR